MISMEKYRKFFIFVALLSVVALSVFLGYVCFDVAFHLGMSDLSH